MTPLTRPQQDWLQALCELTEAHGHPPTLRELGAAYGATRKAAHGAVSILHRKGFVSREGNKDRATVPLRWPSGRIFGPATAWPPTMTTDSGVELRMTQLME